MAAVKDEIRAELDEAIERRQALNTEWEGKRFSEEARDEFNMLCDKIKDHEETLAELDRREQLIDDNLREEGAVETPQIPRPSATRGDDIWDYGSIRHQDPSAEADEYRSRALRAVEEATFPHERVRHEDVQTKLSALLDADRDADKSHFARHFLATGSPAYRRAFTKYLAGTPRTATEDGLLMRAMSLTTTSGGFAVPFVLDPSVILSSDGAINPYRAIASVQQIAVDEWRGVTSAGITAAFQAEAAATTDNSPTLAQPTVSTEMARAFVPFSIEIGMDWAGFSGEMSMMLSDAKDVLEATKMAVGSGTNEPFGVITGATTVFTASNTNSLVVADIYGVHNALGPRFRARASWTMNNAVGDRIRQLDTAGGANLWIDNLTLRSAAVPNSPTDGRMGADLLGKPVYEASGQSGAFTTGQLIAVFGDFSKYKVIDRIGLTVETIPHLFGAAQGNLPTMQRGLVAYWRVGAKVLHANAFRVLKLA